MAQLPLKIPTTYSISQNTATIAVDDNPRPLTERAFKHPKISLSQSNADHRMIKSILCFFRSSNRKQGANPPSSEKFKFISCFSNPSQVASDASLHSRFFDSSKGSDTQVHKQDNKKIERNISGFSEDEIENDSCFSYDFRLEDSNVETPNSVGDSEEIANYLIEDSPNDAKQIEVTSALDDREEIKFELFKSQNKDMEIATFNSMRTLPTCHSHGLDPFVVKIQKLVNYPGTLVPTSLTKDAKRRIAITLLSLDNKHKSFFKKENQQQIWTKPILMGKRCQKLDGDFPYGDDRIRNGSKIDGEHKLP